MNYDEIRPLSDIIFVRRAPVEEMTKSGLIIPDSAKDKPQSGEIVAAGLGKRTANGTLVPMSLKVGEKVLFSMYTGNAFQTMGEELLMMRESDVIGLME